MFCFMQSSWNICTACLTGVSGGFFRFARPVPDAQGDDFLRSGDDSLKKPQAARAAKVQSKDRDMGAALRSVYQKTVDETVPPEMLDLLGKLT